MVDIFLSRVACNTYTIFEKKEHAIVVDPGYNVNNCLIEHLHKIGVHVDAILITHAHYDHIDALEDILKEYKDAVVYIGEDEFPCLDNPKFNLSAYNEWGKTNIKFMPKNIVKLMDGEEFETCGYTIKCINTAFHTKGSVCYIVDKENALFSGDTLFYTTIGRSDLPGAIVKQIGPSLTKLVDLNRNYDVFPGHGPKTTLDRERKYNSYLRNI